MAATIKDVARLAGVSPSTVSRVLNQKGVISEETKQKIASAMEQLKYVPNDIARSFANGSAHAISLVIDISDGTAYANISSTIPSSASRLPRTGTTTISSSPTARRRSAAFPPSSG